MDIKESHDVTLLLHRWKEGDPDALHQLMPLVYQSLYQRAHQFLRGERKNHSLSSTVLVNEAFVRLVKEQDRTWENRSHFFAIAATIMRHLLVNFAELRNTQKRGGEQQIIQVENPDDLPDIAPGLLIDLEFGMDDLRSKDPRKALIFELRCIVGLSLEEISEQTGYSLATVKRDLNFAKTWLRKFLKGSRS